MVQAPKRVPFVSIVTEQNRGVLFLFFQAEEGGTALRWLVPCAETWNKRHRHEMGQFLEEAGCPTAHAQSLSLRTSGFFLGGRPHFSTANLGDPVQLRFCVSLVGCPFKPQAKNLSQRFRGFVASPLGRSSAQSFGGGSARKQAAAGPLWARRSRETCNK